MTYPEHLAACVLYPNFARNARRRRQLTFRYPDTEARRILSVYPEAHVGTQVFIGWAKNRTKHESDRAVEADGRISRTTLDREAPCHRPPQPVPIVLSWEWQVR